MADFLTVPDELVELADRGATYFVEFGYTVATEPKDIELPYMPALRCKRNSTTTFVEVSDRVDDGRLSQWVAYGRSCSRDTQVAVLLPEHVEVTGTDVRRARESGYGILQTNGESVVEVVPPVDLALALKLPTLNRYPNHVRKALGPAFERIRRGNWREGFEDACNALEEEARRYLIKGIESGRVTMHTKAGKNVTPARRQVERMTLGQLKDQFLAIDNPNHADGVIGQALKRLNPDRIRAVHNKRKSAAEATLRKNVGRQIWLITGALDEM